MRIIVALLIMTMLLGCTPADTSTGGSPFVGGTAGLDIQFAEGSPPAIVYDGGNFPFSISLRLQNMGEHFAAADKVKVSIDGIRPEEFHVTQADLMKNPPTDLIEKRKLSSGEILESSPVYVEFKSLNHKDAIAAGTELTYPIKGTVCYQYGTIATSQLCTRKNILDPRGAGVCEINEVKTVHNSGGPLQITSLTEHARSMDSVGFTFTIGHSGGAGDVFKPATECDRTAREVENMVAVRVISEIQGLTCSNLENGDHGFVRLFNGQATIQCTQPILSSGDYTFPVRLEVSYDYEQSVSTQLTVKHTSS